MARVMNRIGVTRQHQHITISLGIILDQEAQRLNAAAYWDNGDYDELESKRTRYEERRMLLIDHYTLMYRNCTLQCNVR